MAKQTIILIIGLLGVLAGILALALGFCVLCLITKVVIWIVLGLFSYDLSDKFWHVFGLLVVLNMLFGGSLFSIRIRGNNGNRN